MNYDEFRAAIDSAKSAMSLADSWTLRLAELVVPRIRLIYNASTLRRLKTALRDFDSRTGKWK